MDLGDYWQENKRFVTGVGAGVVVFLIGFALVRSYFEGDIQSKRREIGKRESDLAQPMFSATELADAQAQHDALTAAVAELTEAARFEPRPEFKIPSGVVQGGIVATMLDMAMAVAGDGALSTASLELQILRPVVVTTGRSRRRVSNTCICSS